MPQSDGISIPILQPKPMPFIGIYNLLSQKTEFINVHHIESYNLHSNIITMTSGATYQVTDTDRDRVEFLILTLLR